MVLPRDELQPKCAGFHSALRIGSAPSDVGCTWSTVNESGVEGGASYWIGPSFPPHSQHGVLLRLHSALNAARSLRQGLPAAGMTPPRCYFARPRSSCLACRSCSTHSTSQASIAQGLEYSEWQSGHM